MTLGLQKFVHFLRHVKREISSGRSSEKLRGKGSDQKMRIIKIFLTEREVVVFKCVITKKNTASVYHCRNTTCALSHSVAFALHSFALTVVPVFLAFFYYDYA